MTYEAMKDAEEQKHHVPRFSSQEVRILEFVLKSVDELGGATPSLSQIAQEVYGDPGKKKAVHYHVQALR